MRAPVVVLALVAAPAYAGSRPYAFTQGAEGLATNELELESWFTYENPRGMGTSDLVWDWWLGPVTGITDHLEAGLFAIFDEPAAGPLSLEELRLQVTYAPWDRGSHAVELRIRGELGVPLQFVPAGGAYSAWLTAIVAKQVGKLDLTANAGMFVEREKEIGAADEIKTDTAPYTLVGLGASYDLGVKLRAGIEAYSEVKLAEPANGYWFGPAIAYGTGRFWLAGSFLFGLTGDTDVAAKQLGRVVLGITI